MRSSTICWLSISVLFPTAIAWWCLDCPRIGIDDANIMFSYAKNIANGLGFTYANNGVPVEGSTSLLWTFISALSFLVGLNEAGVLVLSVLLLVVSVYVWLMILWRTCESFHISSLILLLLLFSCPGYLIWMSFTCMDIALWGLFVALFTYDLIAFGGSRSLKHPSLGLLYLLAPWVRPESYLAVPMVLVLMSIKAFLSAVSLKGLCFRVSIFSLSLLSLFSWRMLYFGYPFPNTYYAKVSPSVIYNLQEGLKYLKEYLGNEVALVLMIVIVGYVVLYLVDIYRSFRDGSRRTSSWYCLAPWGAGLVSLPVLTGGDHFSCFRFFEPAYPLGCILAATVIGKIVVRIGRRLGDSVVGVSVGLSVAMMCLLFGWNGDMFWLDIGRPTHRMRREFSIAEIGHRNGEAITAALSGLKQLPRLGVICAGGIARSYKGEIVDLMGLNDVRIAHDGGNRIGIKNHAAFNAADFLKYDVEMFPFSPVHTVDIKGVSGLNEFNQKSLHSISSVVLKGLFEKPSFTGNWTCVKVSSESSGEHFVSLVRNDIRRLIEELDGVSVTDYMVWDGSHWK